MTTKRKEPPRLRLAGKSTKPWRKEKINMRLADISPELLTELKSVLPHAKAKTNERRAKDKNKLVVLLELDDSIDCDVLCEFIAKHKIPKRSYKLYASVVTEGYMGGIRVPKFLVRLLCSLGCELNFSFVKV